MVGLVEGADVGAGRDDLVDPVEDVVGEGDVQAGEQAVEVVHGAGAEKCAGDAGVGDGERHREVGHGQPGLGGERDELLNDVKAVFVGEVVDHAARRRSLCWSLRTRPVSRPWPSGPQTRVPRPKRWVVGQDLALDAAVEDGVGRLLGVETREAAPFGDPLGLDDAGGGGLRGADRADLAAADQVGQRGEGFLDVGAGIGAVKLVEVDVVGPQATQRVLHGDNDPPPRGALVTGVLPDRAAELGGEHNLVPAPFQGLANDVLGVAVGVGGVDEVDAGVQRPADDAGRILRGIAHDGGEHQGAQGVGADLDAGPAEGAVLHGVSLPVVVGTGRIPYAELSGKLFRNYTESFSV